MERGSPAASAEACTSGVEARRAGTREDPGLCLLVGRARRISRLQPRRRALLRILDPFTATNREAGDESVLEEPPVALDGADSGPDSALGSTGRCRRAIDPVGGQGRNRTIDTRIFSPLLYQLSYLAALRAPGEVPGGRRI